MGLRVSWCREVRNTLVCWAIETWGGFPKKGCPFGGLCRVYMGIIQGHIGFRDLDFPRLGGSFLGVPRIRPIAFWSLYGRSPILGNYYTDATAVKPQQYGNSSGLSFHQ